MGKLSPLRQTKHDRSTIPVGDESAKVSASLLDFLEVLRVYNWFRHESACVQALGLVLVCLALWIAGEREWKALSVLLTYFPCFL